MADTQQFREMYRKEEIGPGYSGILHFCFTSGTCLLIIIICIYFLDNVKWTEWLVVPVTFIFANYVEYSGHKGPMHHKRKLLEKVFTRHTLQHHRFFTNEVMVCQSVQDFKMILFPPVLLIFFFVGFALPVGLLIYLFWSLNATLLFCAMAIAYFLNYEWLHLAYHLPEGHWIAKLPIVKSLRRLHQNHHNPHLMQKNNFNISYPIFDWVMGTLYREN